MPIRIDPEGTAPDFEVEVAETLEVLLATVASVLVVALLVVTLELELPVLDAVLEVDILLALALSEDLEPPPVQLTTPVSKVQVVSTVTVPDGVAVPIVA